MRKMLPLFLIVLPVLSGAEFLPLETGNEWVYRDSLGAAFQVRIGTPAVIDGNVYHRLIGYATQALWVRKAQDGAIYVRDEENGRDVIFLSFEPFEGGWFYAPYRPCEQEGQVQLRRAQFEGPAGRIDEALRVRFRSFGCADAGVEEELFAENIGMLRRTVSTIAGPRTAQLVYARVGNLTLKTGQGASFDLRLSVPDAPDRVIRADLRLNVTGPLPLLLTYPSSQEYEMVLKDAEGTVLWRWSDGRFFEQAERTVSLGPGSRLTSEEIPAPDKDGIYSLEAWITAGESKREFAASARFELKRRQ